MAVFTIGAPDGRSIKIEAPDQATALQGAQEWAASNPARSVQDIQSALTSGKERFTDLPQAERNMVARAERSGGDSTVRALARGVPFIGPFLDEANAYTNAALGGYAGGSQAQTFGQRVEDNLAYERAIDKTYDADRPLTSMGLQVGGGVAGTVAAAPFVAGAGAASAVGRTALGVGAKTLPGAIARGATAGTLQGAASGAGNAEDGFVNRGMGAIGGGATGAVIGAAVPAAVGVGQKVVANVANRFSEPTPLSALSAGAQRYVGQISEPAAVGRMQEELARLGPNAMLADVSPEWAAVARGAAARPGSRGAVVDALAERDAGKNARLAADLDQSLGRAPVPSQVDAEIAARQGQVNYGEPFREARAVNNTALANDLDAQMINARGPAQRAMRDVREMLDIPGERGVLDPNPNALLSTRHAIDGMLNSATDTNVQRVLGNARRAIDDELAARVPGIKDADAQYADLARQREALSRGGQVLDGGKTAIRPQELGPELAQGALPQGTMVGPSAVPMRVAQGVRGEIDRVAGTNANDPVALQRLVKGEGDWNRTKLGQVFGQENADAALGAIDREAQFRNTFNRVTGGSDTAQTTGFKSFLDRAEAPVAGGIPGDMTLFGAAVNGAKAVGGVLAGAMGRERANRYATELARTAIATGLGRDEFVNALQAAGVKQQAISRALEVATRAGLIGSREVPEFLPTTRRDQR